MTYTCSENGRHCSRGIVSRLRKTIKSTYLSWYCKAFVFSGWDFMNTTTVSEDSPLWQYRPALYCYIYIWNLLACVYIYVQTKVQISCARTEALYIYSNSWYLCVIRSVYVISAHLYITQYYIYIYRYIYAGLFIQTVMHVKHVNLYTSQT